MTTYTLIHMPDGAASTLIGYTDTMEAAREMAAAYEAGKIEGMPEYLYGSARALTRSGTNEGLSAPEIGEDDEAIAWIGESGYIAVFAQ